MFGVQIKVDKNIEKFLDSVRKKVRIHSAMMKNALPIVTRARQILTDNRHIITGNLRRDIHVETVKPLVVRVGTRVVYAYFVEVMPDGGFLAPAVREMIDEYSENVGREIMEVS